MTSPVPSDAALRPQPIDALTVPAALDGRAGTNRSTSAHPQIAATHDLDAVRAWLARFVDTPTTFQNYRKEAERLLLWAVISVQLLALYAVCSSQVREAQDRRAQQVLKVRTEGCTTPVTPSLAQACATAASDRTIQAFLGR